jgi:hypothetical protein
LEPEAAAAAVVGLIDGMLLQQMVDGAVFTNPKATRVLVERAVRKMLAP